MVDINHPSDALATNNSRVFRIFALAAGLPIVAAGKRAHLMELISMLFIVIVGTAFIYAGYKLFCGLPAMTPKSQTSRASVLFMNVIPGALLALVGTGLLTMEAMGMMSHRPAMHRQAPASEGAAWHRGHPGFLARSA